MTDAASIADGVIDAWTHNENQYVEMGITHHLDELAELQAKLDELRLQQQELVEQVLTPEIRQAIADIEAEYAPQLATCQERINLLTAQVKNAVVQYGSSVKGDRLHAVYSRGRDRWDSKALMRMAKDYPALWDAHSQGKPSVAIRKV